MIGQPTRRNSFHVLGPEPRGRQAETHESRLHSRSKEKTGIQMGLTKYMTGGEPEKRQLPKVNGTNVREQDKTGNHLFFGGSGSGAAVLGANLGEGSFGNIRPLAGIFQLVLHLAVLGEVHGGDLLGLLDLALVGLNLGLEFLNEILHALHVFAVLLGLECEFFKPPVSLPEVLSGFSMSPLLGIELSLELPDAGLKLGNDALASLEGGGFSLIKAGLEVLDSNFQLLTEPVDVDGVLLLTAEFLSQVGGIGSSLLGLLLGVLELSDGIIHISLHGLEILLQLSLGTGQHGISSGKLLNATSGIMELSLGGLLRPVRGLEGHAHLLKLGCEHVAAPLRHVVSLTRLLACALLILNSSLELLNLS